MAESRKSLHGEWSSRLAFILAATGSAVGLGNIWKFPYITGENGGGAFVLVYLICIFVIGIPIMMAEVMLGRRGRRSPINTMRHLASDEGHSPHWQYLGWLGVLAGFLILSYYSVIAGWAMSYIFKTADGTFVGATADGVNSIFSNLLSNPEGILCWHTIFMVMTMIVVSRGVRGGLEKAVKFMMPALFALLLILLGYSVNTGYFDQGLAFMFNPDFSKLGWKAVVIAMGHSFFTLSLGMGAIMVYGSYLPHNASIAKTSIAVSLADTAVALTAGMVIFPIVFANGLQAEQGPGLIFKTLPIAFGTMDGGTFFGTLFFILLVFAAWTSSISLIEPAVAWLVENHGFNRVAASVWAGIVTWLVGLITVFSFNIWSDVKLLHHVKGFEDATPFDLMDFVTSNLMLPIGGLLIAIFAVWLMSKNASRDELKLQNETVYLIWRYVVKFITPIAVLIVLVAFVLKKIMGLDL